MGPHRLTIPGRTLQASLHRGTHQEGLIFPGASGSSVPSLFLPSGQLGPLPLLGSAQRRLQVGTDNTAGS